MNDNPIKANRATCFIAVQMSRHNICLVKNGRWGGDGDSLAEMELEGVFLLLCFLFFVVYLFFFWGGGGGEEGGVELGMIYCLSEAFAYVIRFFL